VAARPLVIQVVGDSGSGKTLVVERSVRRLRARGLSVAVVKHSHHSPDLRGKDSDRFTRAGARVVLFAGPASFVTFRGNPQLLVGTLPVDVVLVEGYSRRSFGPLRFRIRRSSEVPRLVARILQVSPRAPRSTTLVLDGRRKRTDLWWRFVANLMEARGVLEVRKSG